MSETERVTVTVAGQNLGLKTDHDGEYVRELAKSVDQRLKELRDQNPSLTPARAAVLLCLELKDEMNQLEKDYQGLLEELNKIEIV
ncbi:MAG: cell division protein ZapA [Bacillota bacterium]|nr:cell division protein ZapA [Bacillota bacterium]